ncbi:MAG: twin-arginine translocase subunit TatB [Rhodospirillaceae bacterium]|jgi:sec-independent protein translocase protein TatB|nr:twin-arginine translocase subunit TatB [Rhodospirillaceae bacterium]MBT7265752.1 twin-arginine translocase subunit TatB [Rhodospirillaceae bacterium]
MFDIGWTEITIILIVAIIVVGPKDLPRVLRTVGQWVGKAKSMTREFRGHVDDMIRDTELDEVKKQIESAGSFDANTALENTIDPDGEIKNAFDFSGDEFANPVDLDDPAYDEDDPDDPDGTAVYDDDELDEDETAELPDAAPEGMPEIAAEEAPGEAPVPVGKPEEENKA